MVGEPRKCYLSYILIKSEKSRVIEEEMKDAIANITLEDTLTAIGSSNDSKI